MDTQEIRMLDARTTGEELVEITLASTPSGDDVLYVSVDDITRFRLVHKKTHRCGTEMITPKLVVNDVRINRTEDLQ